MKVFLLLLLSVICSVGLAFAGKNENGALVVHTDDGVAYTFTADYCGDDYSGPVNCESAWTRADKDIEDAAVVWLLAAFPWDSTPAVTVIYFGLEHSLLPGYIVNQSYCGPVGSIEIPDDGWPDEWESAGTSIAFGSAISGEILFPFYWLAAYGSTGDFLGTGINPSGGYAGFVDDNVPGNLDYIDSFGAVYWQSDLGSNDCPPGTPGTPNNLTAEAQAASSILLQWKDNSAQELGYEIERKIGESGTWGLVHETTADTESWIDEYVGPGETYYYRVRAWNENNIQGYAFSEWSNEAGARLPGKNEGGALVVHTNDAVSYTIFGGDYCGLDFSDPVYCDLAYTTTNKDENDAAVIWFLAAFPNGSHPAVTVIYFGVEHNFTGGQITRSAFCGPEGTIEVPDDGWPDTGFGNSVAFGSTVADELLFPFYWFAAYGFSGAYLGTGINPTGGYAGFVDDSVPGVLDTTDLFGRVKWMAPGYNECPEGPPAAPSELTAGAQGTTSILLGWQDNSNRELGFSIERNAGGGWTNVASNPPDDTSLVDSDVVLGGTYYYRVYAFNDVGSSSYSNTVIVHVVNVPGAPTDLSATAVSPVGIDLTWVDNASDEIGFHLERKPTAAGDWVRILPSPGANIESYEDRNLTPGTEYEYRIRSYNEGATSDWSNIATGTTDPPPPPEDAGVYVRFNLEPVEGATVYVDSGSGFEEQGLTGPDGTVQVADLNLGDRIRAIADRADYPSDRPGHEDVGDVVWELWLDSDDIQPNGSYLPFIIESLSDTYTLDLVHPVFRINLTVCVGWDIPVDGPYWDLLEGGLNSASTYLYNVTDGQFALGNIAITDDCTSGYWSFDHPDFAKYADVRIHPTYETYGDQWGLYRAPQYTLDTYFSNKYAILMPDEVQGMSPDQPQWYRRFAKAFGSYVLGLLREDMDGNGRIAQWAEYRQLHPELYPINFGFMDDPYITTEMSSSNDYWHDFPWADGAGPLPAEAPMQFFWNRYPSWEYVKTEYEYFWPEITITTPPHGRYSDNVTPDRLGPTGDIGLLGDLTINNDASKITSPPSITRIDRGPGIQQDLRLRVESDGHPAVDALVYAHRIPRRPPTKSPSTETDSFDCGVWKMVTRLSFYFRDGHAVSENTLDFHSDEPATAFFELESTKDDDRRYRRFDRDDVEAPGAVIDIPSRWRNGSTPSLS